MKNKGKGFANMTPERLREVASSGGKVAHANGTAHKWNSETGKVAGKLGVKARIKAKQEQEAEPKGKPINEAF